MIDLQVVSFTIGYNSLLQTKKAVIFQQQLFIFIHY